MQQSCIVCDNTYTSKMKRQYCSAKCRKAAWKILNREKYLEDARQYQARRKLLEPIKPIVELSCKFCGKLFIQNNHHPEQTCCSHKCSNYLYRKNNPEKVSLWKMNDRLKHKEQYKERDTKYKDMLRYSGNRIIALRRDDYTCTECLKSDPEVNLIVHHKDFSGQDKKPNNKIENLTTLCRSCHIRLHLLNK